MKRKKNREGGLEKVSFTQRLKIIHEFMNEENKDEAKAQLLQMEELNGFSSCTIENCIFLQDLFIKLGLSIPRELLEREFALQKDTNKGLIKYLALVLNKVGHKLSFEEVWEVVFKRALTFSDEQSVKLSQLLTGHGQEVKSEEFLEIRSDFRAKRQQNAEKLQIATRWTFWDFARLFFAIFVPAGIIFTQYYFWGELSSLARENFGLLIGAMEISTGLTLWGLLKIVFVFRDDRMKLPKAEYDVLERQKNIK